MPSGRLRGLLPALLGLIALGTAVAWFGVVKPQRARESVPPPAATLPPGTETPAKPEQTADLASPAPSALAPSEPVEAARDQAKAKATATPSLGSAPAPQTKAAPTEANKPSGPSLDVVRVEPGGESVIAGRGAPGATIEMLRNGKSHARALADTSGLFAFVPPPLPPGPNEISFTSIAPDGTRAQSRESVTVVINEDRATKPLVTLTSPDKPTVVLSAPEPSPLKAGTGTEVAGLSAPTGSLGAAPTPNPQPHPANAGAQPPAPRPGVRITSVEAEEGGRLFVSGNAAAGATVRLYLNESFIAPGGSGSDGKVSFAIGRGVRPGGYRVRLDDVDPVSGEVKSRAEVAFNVPQPLTVPLPPQAQPLLPAPDLPGVTVAGRSGLGAARAATQQANREATAPQGSTASSERAGGFSASASARSADPGTIIVPEINTAIVARGDNLWRISRRIYGQGTRYTVIYDANMNQIRNPNRIYPGQLFVLPFDQAPAAAVR